MLGECFRQSRKSDLREGDKVLDDALAADEVVKHIDMRAEEDVEQIICAVCFEDGKTLTVLCAAEEGNGATNVWFEFEEVAEVCVFEDGVLKLLAVHRGQGAETAVDCYVVCGHDGAREVDVCDGADGGV